MFVPDRRDFITRAELRWLALAVVAAGLCERLVPDVKKEKGTDEH